MRQRYPDLSSGTLRALVLSLSPAADDARAWLRGEADQILEERLRVLRLGECSPDPGDVIRAPWRRSARFPSRWCSALTNLTS